MFFTDKAGSPYTVDEPGEFLSQRAIARRNAQNIPIIEEDLPVNSEYVCGIQALGVSTRFTTKWLNGVLVKADSASLQTVLALDYVDSASYAAPLGDVNAFQEGAVISTRLRKQRKYKGVASGELTALQNQMIGIDYLHGEGHKGLGKWVAVFDAGFPGANQISFFQHIFNDSRLIASRDFIGGTDNVYQYNSHGTQVWSAIGAFEEGRFTGTAPEASFVLCVTENDISEYRLEEYNWLFAAEFADSLGVDVVNSSLGYYDFDDPAMNYSYDDMYQNISVSSRAAKILASKGVAVVNSAGNEGRSFWKYLGFPADTPEILTIGSVTRDSLYSSFSSLGYETDGAPVKPDLAAMGSSTVLVNPSGSIFNSSGTSYSAPLVSGMVASLWGAFPEYSAQELIQEVRSTGSQYSNPDNRLGYGIPDSRRLFGVLSGRPRAEGLSVFPNPVQGRLLKIRWNDVNRKGMWFLRIYDFSGNRVYVEKGEKKSGENEAALRLPELAAGKYLVRIQTEEKSRVFKIILQ